MSRFAKVLAIIGVVGAASLLGAATAPAKSAVQLPLRARVLHAGDFLGLRPRGTTVVRSAGAWARKAVPAGGFFDATLLKRSGFAGGVVEFLNWQARRVEGLSIVVQLGSPAAARKYEFMYRGYPPFFAVRGIPHAFGFGNPGGMNIVFADGDFAYLVGAGWNPGSPHALTRAQVTAAARLLYRRVHGH